ncbi:hypothetical protein OKW30_000776 [Paraburkholderia sp. Clong3]
MIGRLISIFTVVLGIWFVACSISWVGGAYVYALFNSKSYSPGWIDIEGIIKLDLTISFSFTFFAWLKIRRQ